MGIFELTISRKLDETCIITGWWFQTWLLFFHMLGMSSFPADELHHFSSWVSWVETGNQLLSYWCLVGDGWVDGGCWDDY